ncbi:MAG: ABC transporter permease subunit, partial [Lachnospiraceae bacterium]|nr:ABC transporter permease subunit [Lachnospiraceae bacterium]
MALHKRTLFLTGILFVIFCFGGCKKQENEKITSIEQLNEPTYTIGVPEGGAGMYMAEKYLPKAEQKTFSGNTSGYLAISQGKLDGFVYDRVMMEFAIASGLENVELLEENLGESMDVAVGISPKSQIGNLKDKVNQFLADAKAEGTLDDMYDRWVSKAESTMPEISMPQAPSCKIKVGTTGMVQPFSYYEGTVLTGYDVELIYRFGAWLNAEVEIKIYDYDGIIAAAEAGDIDCIMANLNATEERRKRIEFSDCVYPSETAVMVRSGQEGQNKEKYKELSDFAGARFAALNGGVYDKLLQEAIAGAEDFSYYNSVPDIVAALKAGRVDAGALDEPLAQLAVAKNEGLKIFEEPVVLDEYGYAFPKGSPLREQFNTAIKEFKEDGTIASLKEKWLGADESVKELIGQDWPGDKGTIRYYYDSTHEPMTYVGSGGEPLGLEIDLMLLVARELDMKVEMTTCEFASLIAALESGKADVASGSMSITEERAKRIDFADTHYESAMVLLVRDLDGEVQQEGFWSGLKDSFRSTFIVEGRWRLILQGLGVTILISVLSGIFGLCLGFFICMLRRTGYKPIQLVGAVFVRVVQGMPIVVFLMILYYGIFGSVGISEILVAVIGFSINFAAYSSEMMRTGIETVDKGQSEAALAMGYTKSQTFFKIVFPQAARNFIPVLKGEFISMVKMTSVVGYIAVQDLTKVSDIIRSRTMEAFFPLIMTAVIYFAVANIMT